MFLETFYILEMPTTAGRVHFYPKGNGLGYTDTRNREHEEAVFKGNLEEDATTEHADSSDCELDWEGLKTIAVEPMWFRRKV